MKKHDQHNDEVVHTQTEDDVMRNEEEMQRRGLQRNNQRNGIGIDRSDTYRFVKRPLDYDPDDPNGTAPTVIETNTVIQNNDIVYDNNDDDSEMSEENSDVYQNDEYDGYKHNVGYPDEDTKRRIEGVYEFWDEYHIPKPTMPRLSDNDLNTFCVQHNIEFQNRRNAEVQSGVIDVKKERDNEKAYYDNIEEIQKYERETQTTFDPVVDVLYRLAKTVFLQESVRSVEDAISELQSVYDYVIEHYSSMYADAIIHIITAIGHMIRFAAYHDEYIPCGDEDILKHAKLLRQRIAEFDPKVHRMRKYTHTWETMYMAVVATLNEFTTRPKTIAPKKPIIAEYVIFDCIVSEFVMEIDNAYATLTGWKFRYEDYTKYNNHLNTFTDLDK